ncbi:MAG: rhodanese-like domain-containing protein [Phycisphaerales bacterium JB040]
MNIINARQLSDMLDRDDDWVLIDTLPAESYEKRHIPGAHHVPTDAPDFVGRVEDLVESRDDPVVVYCANTDCDLSPRAAEKLEGAGFTNVHDFEGGLEAWEESGHEVTSEAEAPSAR